LKKVLPGMLKSKHAEIVGLSSRNLDAARAEAKKLKIPKAYGSYEEMLADPEIDAVYNPLPNHLHVPWSIKALEAGKHVLCEKPIALTTEEAQTLADAAKRYPHLKVMEAFMYRHHPQWQRAKKMVAEGKVGDLRTINSFFSYYNADPNNIRNQADIGGGGLMDIGCYNISLSRFIFDAEPDRVVGIVEYDPKLKTDRLASALMDFGRGTSTFTCSTQLTNYQRVNIFGTEGRVEIEIPFNAPPDQPCKMWYQKGNKIQEIKFPITDQYALQGELMSLAILNDTPVPTPIEDAVENMRVMEAIIASSRDGAWVMP
jgi:predicted dehydrogenase